MMLKTKRTIRRILKSDNIQHGKASIDITETGVRSAQISFDQEFSASPIVFVTIGAPWGADMSNTTFDSVYVEYVTKSGFTVYLNLTRRGFSAPSSLDVYWLAVEPL